MGDYSIQVVWVDKQGQQRTTGTQASRYESVSSQISGMGGRVVTVKRGAAILAQAATVTYGPKFSKYEGEGSPIRTLKEKGAEHPEYKESGPILSQEEVIGAVTTEAELWRSRIKPSATYIEDGKQVFGTELIQRISSQEKLAVKDISGYPPVSRFELTKTGFAVSVPEGYYEKQRFYDRPYGEQLFAEFFAPITQFGKSILDVVSGVSGGAVKVGYETDVKTGKRYTYIGGEKVFVPGESVFLDVSTIAPTYTDFLPWYPSWRKEWIGQRLEESPVSRVILAAGEGFAFAEFNLLLKPVAHGIKQVKLKVPVFKEVVSQKVPFVAKIGREVSIFKEHGIMSRMYERIMNPRPLSPYVYTFEPPFIYKAQTSLATIGKKPFAPGPSFGSVTYRDMINAVRMSSYVPSRYESFMLGRFVSVEGGLGVKELALINRPPVYGYSYSLNVSKSGEVVSSVVPSRKPVDLVVQRGKSIGYRYIGETKGFKAPYKYEPFGLPSDIGYRYIGVKDIVGSPVKVESFGVSDVGYRYVTQLKVLPRFKKLEFPVVYQSMESYGLPGSQMFESYAVKATQSSKIVFTTIGGFKPFTISSRALLYDMEESQVVHPRWDVVKKTNTLMSSMVKQIPTVKSLDVFKTPVVSVRSIVADLSVQGLVKSQVSTSISGIQQLSIQRVLQQQIQQQELDTAKSIKQILLQFPKSAVLPGIRFETIIHPEESRPPLPFLFDLPKGIGESMSGQGYKVLIKERQYYHGKPKGSASFKTMPIHSLSYSDAQLLGQYLTDRSVGMSYKLVPTGGKPKPLNLNLSGGLGYKFYKKGSLNIERRNYAIDTQGEVKQLSSFSVLRGLRKQSFKPVIPPTSGGYPSGVPPSPPQLKEKFNSQLLDLSDIVEPKKVKTIDMKKILRRYGL